MPEKIRVTVVVEYTPDLDHYPVATVEEAAEFDERENPLSEYPSAYLADPEEVVSVTYEVVST
ncbi:hypothetical protein ACIQUL_36380 [Streptomyces sp. NPDC090303]|uniref:hypothetical protein n=1 Tax=Streptomyces sp. NPDC090303 TaxID=3365960 RepID=UPI0038160E2A